MRTDFNQNGIPDACDFAATGLGFNAAVNFTVGSQPGAIISADFNGDGARDLAVGNFGSDTVSILINAGNGSFLPAVNYAGGNNPQTLQAVDVDGDGDLDLVYVNSGFTTDHSFCLLRNNGNGTFAPRVITDIEQQSWRIACARLDADADIDVAAVRGSAPNLEIVIYSNNGNGVFSFVRSIAANIFVRSIVAADIDRDGDADLITASQTPNLLSIFRNNGNATFAPPVTYPIGNNPVGMIVADLDGDGDLDVATGHFSDQTDRR